MPTPDGRKLYVANVGSGSVTSIELETGEVETIPAGKGAEGIDVSPDGREVWVGSNDEHTLKVIAVATDSVVATFGSGGRVPIRVKFTPDGRQVWVSSAESNTVTVVDVPERRVLQSFTTGREPDGMAWWDANQP